METKPALKNVHAFWNTEACDTKVVGEFTDEKDFFEKFREQRYRTQWHIPLLVPFAEMKGQSVLEIGIGNGADATMIASNGGIYTGADLTEAALDATRRHFEVLGLTGTFRKENAEQLSFPDASFDVVYSHGVLHHAPNTQAAIDQVFRVLKPGATLATNVLLYPRGAQPFKGIAERINRWGMRKGILYTPYKREDIAQRIQSAGFEILTEDVSGNCYNVLARKPFAHVGSL